jgi:hypothetical protein
MRLIPRRRSLPADVREALGLVRGEHVLAYAPAEGAAVHDPAEQPPTDGAAAYAVATDRALYLPTTGGYDRLGWETVARATYGKDGVLRVTPAGEPGSAPRVRHLPLDHPGRLPDAVHDRVTSTIVVSQHVRLSGKAGVRLIARRRPGAQQSDPPGDELVWSMSFDEGLDPSDPEVLDAAAAALDDVRRQMGV